MKFNKKKVLWLNKLLKDVRENREKVIDTILSFCPKDGDCDNQLEVNKESLECPYFTLCNVLGSYSLLDKKEQKEADKVLDMIYGRVAEKGKSIYSMFA